MDKKRILLILAALAVTITYMYFSNTMQENVYFIKKSALFRPHQHEHFLGKIDAPLVLVEYASYSCLQCADFATNILPKLNEKYIETGKMLYIFRDFPLDKYALKASMVAHCSNPNPHDPRYFKLYKTLFRDIRQWVGKKDYLETLFVKSMIGPEHFRKCINSSEIEDAILDDKLYAIKHIGVTAAPTFIINGKNYGSFLNLQRFTEIIDTELMRIEALQNKMDQELTNKKGE